MSEDKSIPISPAALAAFAKATPAGIPGVVGTGVPDTPPPLPEESAPAQKEQLAETDISERSEKPEAVEEPEGANEFAEDEASNDESAVIFDPRYPITILQGFCTRLAGSTCDRCTYVCPYDAISFDQEGAPQIDIDHCTRCGLCCGICDAFVTERITQNDLLEKARRLSAEGEPIFFTCYDQIPEDFEVHPNVIVLPCIGAVAPEFWASVLKTTENVQIYCDFELCRDCPTAGPDARDFFTHAVNTGEVWSQVHMGKTQRLPEKTDLLSRFFDATSEEYQRRGIATSLAHEIEDIASGKHRRRNSETLNSFHERKDRMRAQGHAHNMHHHQHVPSSIEMPMKKLWPRLRMIEHTIKDHPDMAVHVPRYLAAIDRSSCEHCYEPCFSHCPAGARFLDDAGNVEVDPLLCIACGNCALYCPTNAAYLFETNGEIFLEEPSGSSASSEDV